MKPLYRLVLVLIVGVGVSVAAGLASANTTMRTTAHVHLAPQPRTGDWTSGPEPDGPDIRLQVQHVTIEIDDGHGVAREDYFRLVRVRFGALAACRLDEPVRVENDGHFTATNMDGYTVSGRVEGPTLMTFDTHVRATIRHHCLNSTDTRDSLHPVGTAR
jgi:hypothetical protein